MHILAHTHLHIYHICVSLLSHLLGLTTAIAITVIVAVGAPSVAIFFPFFF